MPKFFLKTAVVAAFVVSAAPALAQRDFSDVEIKTTDLGAGVYMLEGAGGNIGLSVGEDGAFVIDDQFAPLADKIVAAIAEVSDKPVEFVVNTHWHGDHTGGNEEMSDLGAHIVAHDNVRQRLKEGMSRDDGRVTPAAPEGALPVITFSHSMLFYWNGHDIRVWHPENAHTDGDAIIFFKDANIVHMGDVFFNGWYPYIDLESGGDMDGYISTHEKVLSKVDDETRIIPGHGPLASKADLQNTVDMLKEVRVRVQRMIDDGMSEDEVVAASPLADLDDEWSWQFINGERMTRMAYRSLSTE
ncbi:MBL fold metallo-hydrolase [Hyphococcus flavus]|uniref:MBL fold metallo-hydrolase n=1 Tax=Hyphococcus flavus TaxID=1866326 RepID=A0AAE9ZCC8_9PROT|nr:MBL fold metallo-hydrolase [Hyphococcus flavus]WDI32119.1 MBL fold metallo-hydrolase [Hyphococcus flavus]